jgi:hypothetical protein
VRSVAEVARYGVRREVRLAVSAEASVTLRIEQQRQPYAEPDAYADVEPDNLPRIRSASSVDSLTVSSSGAIYVAGPAGLSRDDVCAEYQEHSQYDTQRGSDQRRTTTVQRIRASWAGEEPNVSKNARPQH